MPSPRNRDSFQTQLVNSGHRALVFLPIAAIILGLVGQALFTNYLHVDHASYLYVLAAIAVALAASSAINKHPSFGWKVGQQFLYYALAFVAFGYVLPLPTPYLIFVAIVSIVTFFDLGSMGMNIGLASLFVLLTARFFQINGTHEPTKLSLFLVTYGSTAVLAYYATAFLKISQEELGQVENVTVQARDNEQQVQSLINNITDGVIAVNAHLEVIIYNAAALDVLDINIEIKGKRLDKFLKPIDAEQQPVDIAKLLQSTTAPVINRDLRLHYTDDSTINLFMGIAPIYLGYGRSTNNGFTLILRDITREKSLEEERDEFISVVSHELRTPIAISEGNISNAQLIADSGGDQAEVKKALNEAHNQVLFLSDMINDLATLSRAERGKLEINVEAINVHDLVNELVSNYSPQAGGKGLEIKAELDPQLELLQSSKLYVREVLQNFITNAIKYTEKGSVTLRAMPDPKGVRFAVADTGIGISKSDQERVFDKFFRSEDYRTRQANGTGMGLYVTMKLARLIHADIDLQSELNKGSTFTIFIPNLS